MWRNQNPKTLLKDEEEEVGGNVVNKSDGERER